jgi:hypothetical protein
MNPKIKDINELPNLINKYSYGIKLHPDFLFRGQANIDWKLEPSFTRLANRNQLDRSKALQLERECINKFSISASKLLSIENTIDLTLTKLKSPDGMGIDFLGWLVLMQHYFAPTRTLDWSTSCWVALYFACCEEEDYDGVLWIADFKKATDYGMGKLKLNGKKFNSLVTEQNSEEILVFGNALNTNERLEAQQGRFSICTNPLSNHETILNECSALSKIEISKELKTEIMKKLHSMNISAKTLFPGIDGLGKSIREYCSLWDKTSIII